MIARKAPFDARFLRWDLTGWLLQHGQAFVPLEDRHRPRTAILPVPTRGTSKHSQASALSGPGATDLRHGRLGGVGIAAVICSVQERKVA